MQTCAQVCDLIIGSKDHLHSGLGRIRFRSPDVGVGGQQFPVDMNYLMPLRLAAEGSGLWRQRQPIGVEGARAPPAAGEGQIHLEVGGHSTCPRESQT